MERQTDFSDLRWSPALEDQVEDITWKTFVNQSITSFELLDVIHFSEESYSEHLVFRSCLVKMMFYRELSCGRWALSGFLL